MKAARRGFTIIEVLIVIVVIVLVMTMHAPMSIGPRAEARRMKCRSNLRQLGIAMVQYLDHKGDQRYYPWPAGGAKFDGAEWLAALYWSKIVTEPSIFNCPSSSDDNREGALIGATDRVGIPDDAVSYAAKGWKTSPIYRGERYCITDTVPGDTVMASDDTELRPNHRSGFTALFFDGHVEFLTDLDVEGSVGRDAPLDTICN